MLSRLAQKALGSPALRTAAILAGGGAGFALGALALARILPEHEFGGVALLLSLIQVGAALGSLGLPVLINRHQLHASPQLLRYAVVIAVVAAIAAAPLAVQIYKFPLQLALLLAAAIAFASVGRVAASIFHARQRFGASLFLSQSHNWLLLASAPLVLLAGARTAAAVTAIIAVSYALMALFGWRRAVRLTTGAESPPLSARLLWSEGVSAASFTLVLNLFFQLDRLVIGRVLSLQDLATYYVVAAIAGSVFRMLQTAAGYTLAPRLRANVDRATALALLRHEVLLVVGVGIAATGPLVVLTPWLVDAVLPQSYAVSYALVAAVVAVGFVRIWEGFAAAIVSAIGSPRELFWLSVSGWLGVAATVAIALLLRSHGLIGVLGALGFGWGAVALPATLLARSALRRLP